MVFGIVVVVAVEPLVKTMVYSPVDGGLVMVKLVRVPHL